MANETNKQVVELTKGISAVKRVDAAVKPISARQIANKASTLYAYLEKPAELLSLKMLSAAKSAYKSALEAEKPMGDIEYTFLEADSPHIKYALAKFSNEGFGVEVLNASTVKLIAPIGHLQEPKKTK